MVCYLVMFMSCHFFFFFFFFFAGWSTSQEHASVSKGRICSDNCTCLHTEREVADQTCHLTQSQYTDTRSANLSAYPTSADACQGRLWIINFKVTGMTRPGKIPEGKAGIEPSPPALKADALTTRPARRYWCRYLKAVKNVYGKWIVTI